MPSIIPHALRLKATSQRRGLFAWTMLACVCLCGAMAVPYFLGRVYTSDDLWAFHLPLRSFYAGCLARGDSFDWMPSLFGGFYVTGEGQGGFYHPLHLALYGLAPLRAAFDLELLLSYPLMLVGAYWFLRRVVYRRDAALLGALVWTFSGFNLLHFVHPNAIAVVAHIPWLLWAIDVAFRDSRPRRVVAAQAAVALLTASQILLGYPQYVWFSLLAELAYAIYVAARRPNPLWLGGRWALFKTLGLLIGAIQLLPTIDMLRTSGRQVADAGFFQSGALHPANVLQLIAPYRFDNRVVGGNTHELGFYLGAVPLALIVWLLAGWKQPLRGKRLIAASLAFGAVALWLALGQYGGLYALQSYLPLANKFRLPARYLVLVYLAAGCLAAVGFRELARQCDQRGPTDGRRLGPLFRLAGFSWMIALLGGFLWDADRLAAWPLAIVGPALLTTAALLVWASARGSRGALVALVVLTAVDLGTYGFSYAVYPNAFKLTTAMSTVPEPPPAPASANRVATDLRLPGDDSPRHGNQDTLKDWRLLDGYAGLEPVSTLDYRATAALRVASVAWVARSPATETISGLIDYDAHWLKTPAPLPLVRMLAQARVSKAPARDLAQIDVETTALVDSPVLLPPGPVGEARILSDIPGRLRIATDAPQRRLLVVSERYHAGWSCRVDGVGQAVLRVNGDFFGCVVEAGKHEVDFAFGPRSLRWGKELSAAGLGLLAVCCCIQLIVPPASRRNPSP